MKKKKSPWKKSPWTWIPSLYYIQALPYVMVMNVSVIMYKNLEISNTDIALYTSWLYLPWVIKPFWSPLVDLLGKKRLWITGMQFLLSISLAAVALSLPGSDFFRYTLAFFWLIAFSSATHDIAADGFYMIGLNQGQQAFFVGIRSTFYRLAMISAQGGLVMLAGELKMRYPTQIAWALTVGLLAMLLCLGAIWHQIILPKKTERENKEKTQKLSSFVEIFLQFFKKKKIAIILFFLLSYRLGEAQLVKIAAPFLLDSQNTGGMALDTAKVGLIYGTIGIIALTAGGILGGIVVSKHGLKHWIWWMWAAINIPNAVYIFLAFWLPSSFLVISAAVALEQFGYGFGFTAYMIYMIYLSEGKYKTTHFALATGFMALGMMLPGMFSGWLQTQMGYLSFFVWVLACALPGMLATYLIPLQKNFGQKTQAHK